MSLGERRKHSIMGNVIVIWIDKNNLAPGSMQLNFPNVCDTGSRSGRYMANSKDVLKMLWTMQHLTHKARTLEKGGIAGGFFKDGNSYTSCIDQFVQFVHSKNSEMLGLRVIYKVNDTTFDYDRALEEIWNPPKPPKGTKPPPVSKEIPRHFTTRLGWVEGLSSYMGEKFRDDGDDFADAMGHPLDDINDTNSASVWENLTWKRSCELINASYAGIVHEDYVCSNLMFGIPPMSIYPVPPKPRDPNVFFQLDISKEPEDPASDEEDEDSTIKRIRANRERATLLASTTIKLDALACARRWVEINMTDELTPFEVNTLCQSKDAMNLIQSVVFHTDTNPGGAVIERIVKVFRDEVPNWSCSPGTSNFIMDHTLSSFANEQAFELHALDDSFDLTFLHPELHLIENMSISACDVQELKLRLHLLLHGGPGTGKSEALKNHEKLSPSGLIQWIATQSRKANTTDECYNGYQMMMDELGDMFGKNSEEGGQTDLKTILSKGEGDSEIAVITEDRKKKTQKSKHQRRCQYLTASNWTKSQVSAPIWDRFYTVNVPMRERFGMISALDSTPSETQAVALRQNQERTLIRQFIAERYFAMKAISVKFMPEICMKIVLPIARLAFQYILKMGFPLSPRDVERIMQLTKNLTLRQAIHEVFISGKTFPPGTPFKDEHIHYIKPYLLAEREHFYMALSSMNQCIVDTSLCYVMEAIKNMVNATHDPSKTTNAASTASKVSGGSAVASAVASTTAVSSENRFAYDVDGAVRNYNYYFVESGALAKEFDVLEALANKIVAVVSQMRQVTLSPGVVKELIKGLMNQSITTKPWVSASTVNDKVDIKVQVVRLRCAPLRAGLEISRDFVEMNMNKKKVLEGPAFTFSDDVISQAIAHTMDAHYPVTRILLGKAWVDGHPQFDSKHIFPHFFQVLEVPMDGRKVIRIADTKYQSKLTRRCAGKDSTTAQSRFITMSTSYDDTVRKEWYEKMGKPAPTSYPAGTTFGKDGSYPLQYMKEYVDDFDITPEPVLPEGGEVVEPEAEVVKDDLDFFAQDLAKIKDLNNPGPMPGLVQVYVHPVSSIPKGDDGTDEADPNETNDMDVNVGEENDPNMNDEEDGMDTHDDGHDHDDYGMDIHMQTDWEHVSENIEDGEEEEMQDAWNDQNNN